MRRALVPRRSPGRGVPPAASAPSAPSPSPRTPPRVPVSASTALFASQARVLRDRLHLRSRLFLSARSPRSRGSPRSPRAKPPRLKTAWSAARPSRRSRTPRARSRVRRRTVAPPGAPPPSRTRAVGTGGRRARRTAASKFSPKSFAAPCSRAAGSPSHGSSLDAISRASRIRASSAACVRSSTRDISPAPRPNRVGVRPAPREEEGSDVPRVSRAWPPCLPPWPPLRSRPPEKSSRSRPAVVVLRPPRCDRAAARSRRASSESQWWLSDGEDSATPGPATARREEPEARGRREGASNESPCASTRSGVARNLAPRSFRAAAAFTSSARIPPLRARRSGSDASFFGDRGGGGGGQALRVRVKSAATEPGSGRGGGGGGVALTRRARGRAVGASESPSEDAPRASSSSASSLLLRPPRAGPGRLQSDTRAAPFAPGKVRPSTAAALAASADSSRAAPRARRLRATGA